MILNKYFEIVINKTARNIKLNDQKKYYLSNVRKIYKKIVFTVLSVLNHFEIKKI